MTLKRVNLFLIQEKSIAVLKLHNEKLECLKRDGERMQVIDETFWDWWKGKMGYVEGDLLDLCFIWNSMHPIIHQSEFFAMQTREDTIWNSEAIALCLSEFDIKANVESVCNSNELEHCEIKEGVFYTNANIAAPTNTESAQDHKTHTKKIAETPIADETPMQRYYREMKERELAKRVRFEKDCK